MVENHVWAVAGAMQMAGYEGALPYRSMFRLIDNTLRYDDYRDIRMYNLASPSYTNGVADLVEKYDKITTGRDYDVFLLLPEIPEVYESSYEHSGDAVTAYQENVLELLSKNAGKTRILWTPLASGDENINGYIDETNKVCGTNSPHITEPGTYTLDGTQAVAYSRIRYTAGSDYKRTERQRTVLFKVFEKSKTMSTSQRLNIVDKLLKEINTSYTQDELLVLIYYMSEYEISTMTAYPKVFYGGSVDGSWVEVPCTLVDMNAELHKILLSEDNYTPSERVKEISETLRNKVKGPNIDQRD